MKVIAAILCAGSGKRFGSEENKIFHDIKGVPIISRTIETFMCCDFIDEIILVVQDEDRKKIKVLFPEIRIVKGGTTRQESSSNGVNACPGDAEYVIIHDCARCLLTKELIRKNLNDAKAYGAAVLAVPAKDTIIMAEEGIIKDTIDRKKAYIVQTPQAFEYGLIKEAHEKAKQDKFLGTDESSLVQRMGHKVHITISDDSNIKITTKTDAKIAEVLSDDI